jgi:hypothetical protein
VLLVGFAVLWSAGRPAIAALPSQLMLELTLHGQKIEGTPVRWSSAQVLLLGRDGRLWHFSPDEARDFHKTSDHFRALSVSGIRAMLLRELGSGYEVSGTGHYLVAHPQGQRDLWAPRFEELYRSFVHYFAVRGFRPREPEFPLIGIVAASRAEFESYSAREGTLVGRGVLGFYSPLTNRIMVYDVGDGRASAADWRKNASVTIHEATHQMAFNTGIHSRYAPPPKWVAEGLATLFEAPGVYDSRAFPDLCQRINRGRYQNFIRDVAPQHRTELLLDIVASDKLFRSAPAQAYAEAWALTFYLVETRPAKYFDYLARTVDHASLYHDTPAQRIADFKVVFGSEVQMLEAQFLRFMKDSSLTL